MRPIISFIKSIFIRKNQNSDITQHGYPLKIFDLEKLRQETNNPLLKHIKQIILHNPEHLILYCLDESEPIFLFHLDSKLNKFKMLKPSPKYSRDTTFLLDKDIKVQELENLVNSLFSSSINRQENNG